MGYGEQVIINPRSPKEIGVHKSTISREFKRNITFVYTILAKVNVNTALLFTNLTSYWLGGTL